MSSAASMRDKPRIVLLGGGNGSSRLLTALLPLLLEEEIASLHALVHMSDDGGSTGRLREQYGVAALGDLTKCLMALSSFHGDVRGDEFLKALDYRFSSGDFEGHTLRNVFLTALEKTRSLGEGEEEEAGIDAAVATMARILQVPKHAGVVPTTLTSLTEQAVITFNSTHNLLGEGQHSISHRVNLQADPRWRPGDVQVRFDEGDVALNPRARRLLQQATHVVVAPGHTYGTILPTLALPDLQRVVTETQSALWVVMTLLTTPLQTSSWRGEDFVRVYESYLGRGVDTVIASSSKATVELVADQDWVHFGDDQHKYRLVEEDIVSSELPRSSEGDKVPRAVVVHDANRLEQIFRRLMVHARQPV